MVPEGMFLRTLEKYTVLITCSLAPPLSLEPASGSEVGCEVSSHALLNAEILPLGSLKTHNGAQMVFHDFKHTTLNVRVTG